MVHFVGAGSGAVDLITVRGAKLLGEADVVIYATVRSDIHPAKRAPPRYRRRTICQKSLTVFAALAAVSESKISRCGRFRGREASHRGSRPPR